MEGALTTPRVILSPDGVHIRSHMVGKIANTLFYRFPQLFMKSIPISSLLMGGENGRSGATFARAIGDPLRTSTPIAKSPHAALFSGYRSVGDGIFEPESFQETPYWHNALRCIDMQGHYFGATDIEGVIERAKRVCDALHGRRWRPVGPAETPENVPVKVRRIRYSDCYEVLDGNHRLAIAAVTGQQRYPCAVIPTEPAITEMQQMVIDSSWTSGEMVLYQPIGLPELRNWIVVRNCTDRLAMMTDALQARGLPTGSYLDVCSSYGWFVDQMSRRGYDAVGIDRDASAVAVGCAAYGIEPSRIEIGDVGKLLSRKERRYDIVSCFSVLHHYVLGRGSMAPEEFIKLVDAATGSVLFLDTGEDHEGWFADSLAGWNAARIIEWLKSETSFTHVEILGTDRDGIGKYEGQYGRHLFACWRS